MVKVRFAPSPTGELHVGNARTALANYLFSKKMRGTMILRIEDTDRERSVPVYEESILDDLRWLGIRWDAEPARQSEREKIYRFYADLLLSRNMAYKCFCTKENLEAERNIAIGKGEPPRYKGTCRNLSSGVAEQYERDGKPFVVRFRSPKKIVRFNDIIRGTIEFPEDHVDDFILLRQDGTTSYNLAAAVDDMLMNITHVIRGSDHLSNTPKQIMLFESFEKTAPSYGHLSLLVGADKKPLSKRHGASRVKDFREMGILATALVNYLGITGRSVQQDVFSQEELIQGFSFDTFSTSDTFFDMEKLLWLNAGHIRRAPLSVILENLSLGDEYAEKVNIIRENAKTLGDLRELLRIFTGHDAKEEALATLSRVPGIEKILRKVADIFSSGTFAPLDGIINELTRQTGLKRKELIMTLRVLLTGRTDGPPLGKIYPLLKQETIRQRLTWITGKILTH